MTKKPVEKTEKQKHGAEHVGHTLGKSSQPNISIEEFSWDREADGSTFEMEEHYQQQIVYITNLEDNLRKNSTKPYDEKRPKQKKRTAKNRLIEEPSLNNLNHVFGFVRRIW